MPATSAAHAMPSISTTPITKQRYIGRFAPTPSGPLHFGSLVAALASYLDAKAHDGLWLLRIEDIDPPREQPGASAHILQTLEDFDLLWDGEVFYQSQQNERYQVCVDQLLQHGLAYYCQCSRKRLRDHPVYPNWCRIKPPELTADCAVRIQTQGQFSIEDRIQGTCSWQMDELGDFIIQRRDKLFAYQLAVVLDDAEQGINQIVRGYDILESTPRQLQLIDYLKLPKPEYAHIPVITNHTGQKLSKQNLAPGITPEDRRQLLLRALQALGLISTIAIEKNILTATYAELLQWAIQQWQISRVPGCAEIPEAGLHTSAGSL